MDAKKVELIDVADGSLLMISAGNEQNFGIRTTVNDSAYFTVLSPVVDSKPGPMTLPFYDLYKFVDLGRDWIFDFEPNDIVMEHDGTPSSGSLVITESGPAILCNVMDVGVRFLFPDGALTKGNRILPYAGKWCIRLSSHSDKWKKVFSWPIGNDD